LSKLEKDIKNLPYSLDNAFESLKNFYNFLYQQIYPEWEKENLIVKNLGGLFVLGTERHETRRIDNQLRGRAGRQGDPGISQFFVSLEDELIKIFGGDNIRRWVEYLVQDKDVPLESDLLTNSLENAQKKVELYNYEVRKNVFQYDNILNNQRKQLFEARNEILGQDIYNQLVLRYSESSLDEELLSIKIKKAENSEILTRFEKLFDPYLTYFNFKVKNKDINNNQKYYNEIWISHDLCFAHFNFYQLGFLKNTQTNSILSIVDFSWTEHIERMSYIRETINWRSYGQQNPLLEYNNEAFKSFKLMFQQIRSCMVYYFLNNIIIV